ncbi:hypothetical protein C900_05313 [Fulvivirga imtechensis AK7]|uniref:Methyltransferase type 11 domain-containing protein n=1 Tax=Fulvivirga imtechensis AK7 TaxID=1237149 RepID=L8JPG6_9BACT|nr:class I SAM-dependent methyltransferase [Fulvivirga imtechensis]ELR69242.1 hypothetical protein C900_05313 [Fulvivirga imtechensis AK7]
MTVKDNFSSQADYYARYRPHYPQELYEFLYSQVSSFNTAWDCATGNGQVAVELANRFKLVHASDISQQQLEKAPKRNNIHYFMAPSEKTQLSAGSADLITVAQALHWFDPGKFYREVQRVIHSKGILAYWGYQLLTINTQIDLCVRNFHDVVLGEYWDDERKILLEGYNRINFPLVDKKAARFYYKIEWTLSEMEGYLNSWSAVQKYIKLNNESPLPVLVSKLADMWPGKKTVTFPIFLTLGKVH